MSEQSPEGVEAVIARISEAFEGVTREGAVSWTESTIAVYDGSLKQRLASYKKRLEARAGERDQTWSDLVDDPDWDPVGHSGTFSSLDRIGFRYYLPPAMIRCLRDPERCELSLYFTASRFGFRYGDFALFTDAQLAAATEFVKAMARADDLNATEPGVKGGWQDAYDLYWHRYDLTDGTHPREAVKLTDAQREMVGRIQAAFNGVTREGGVSWAQSTRDDLYGMSDEEIGDRYSDADQGWRDLVDDPAWDLEPGCGGFSFLDPIGFRYYLPAAMMRAVEDPYYVDFYFSLTPEGSLADWQRGKWSLFSEQQLSAVATFVRYMAETTEITVDGTLAEPICDGWTTAYRVYWQAHDPAKDRPLVGDVLPYDPV